MKVQAQNTGVEDSVILHQLAHLQIKDLHARVLLSDCDRIVVLVPAQLVAVALLVFECMNQLASFHVENSQCFVLGARRDQLIIRRKAGATDPVSMGSVRADEIAMRQTKHFDCLVITSCYQSKKTILYFWRLQK